MSPTSELAAPVPPTIQNQVSRFIQSVNTGFAAWVEAGTVLKSMVDAWGQDRAFMAIRRDHLIPESALHGFLRLGRKEIVPEVLASTEPWAKVVSRLPYDTQREIIDRRTIEIAVKRGNSRQITCERVRLEDLSERQCRQAITSDGRLLSFAQQRELIKQSEPTNRADTNNWTPRDPAPRGRPPVAIITPRSEEQPESDPANDVIHYLSAAQDALLKVREINGVEHQHDDLITACLQAIGKIRNGLRYK